MVDAFQNVNGGTIPNAFYEKNYSQGKKEIVVTDNLLKIKELFQYNPASAWYKYWNYFRSLFWQES